MTKPDLRHMLNAAQAEVEDDGFITKYPAPTHGRGEPGAGSPPPARPPEQWDSTDIAEYLRAQREAERPQTPITWPALLALAFLMTWLAAGIIAAIAG